MSDDRDRSGRPEYTVYRSRRRRLGALLRDRTEPELRGVGSMREDLRSVRSRHGRKPWTARRVIRYVVIAIAAWLTLSLVLFVVSAQIETSKSSSAASKALDGGGPLPFATNTILVLGSDARPKGSHEAGANVVGQPSRSDTIMLIRAGGGSAARLSIPRDTVVDIPGHGPDKINAAYAIGGPALAITTIKQFLGIDINHLVEVNFANFPQFINSMGGIDITTGCVRDNLDGTDQNGGTTINLRRGSHHLDGKHTLGLARVRHNACRPGEDDIDRAKRQQLILSAIKHRLISPTTFLRLPWVSWNAPKAIRTDMGGPSLLGLFAALEMTGSPPTRVLKPSGFATTPGGGSGLTVSEDEKRAAVKRFLNG